MLLTAHTADQQTIPRTESESRDGNSRGRGEFIMSGSFTNLDGVTNTEAVDPADVMPNFMEREEVQTMMTKLRDSVSLWKRIHNARVESAWDNPQLNVLPQHTMYIK